MASTGVSLDIAQYGQITQYFTLSVAHNTPTEIPTGIVPLRTPVNVVYLTANLLPLEKIIGLTWTVGVNNVPSVTILWSANVTRTVQLAVCWLPGTPNV